MTLLEAFPVYRVALVLFNVNVGFTTGVPGLSVPGLSVPGLSPSGFGFSVCFAVTVTSHTAEIAALSLLVTLILAVPSAIAFMLPSLSTVATAGVLELHVTSFTVALVGATVAVSFCTAPSSKDTDVLSKVTPVTATFAAVTVTVHSAFLFVPSFVVALIVVFPAFNAVTNPFVSTVATVSSEDVQSHSLMEALSGVIVAVN